MRMTLASCITIAERQLPESSPAWPWVYSFMRSAKKDRVSPPDEEPMDPFGLKFIFIAFLVFVPLERLFALHPEQKVVRRSWANDLVFLLLNPFLIKLGLLGVIAASIFVAAQIIPASFQAAVGGLPYWVQIPAIIVLSDLGFYWTHRMFHAVPWLWRFHAVHHSIEELDWLAAFRIHPLDQILTKGVARGAGCHAGILRMGDPRLRRVLSVADGFHSRQCPHWIWASAFPVCFAGVSPLASHQRSRSPRPEFRCAAVVP